MCCEMGILERYWVRTSPSWVECEQLWSLFIVVWCSIAILTESRPISNWMHIYGKRWTGLSSHEYLTIRDWSGIISVKHQLSFFLCFMFFVSCDAEYLTKVALEENKEIEEMRARRDFDKGLGKATMVPQLLEKLSIPRQMPLHYCGGLEILSQAVTDCECCLGRCVVSFSSNPFVPTLQSKTCFSGSLIIILWLQWEQDHLGVHPLACHNEHISNQEYKPHQHNLSKYSRNITKRHDDTQKHSVRNDLLIFYFAVCAITASRLKCLVTITTSSSKIIWFESCSRKLAELDILWTMNPYENSFLNHWVCCSMTALSAAHQLSLILELKLSNKIK